MILKANKIKERLSFTACWKQKERLFIRPDPTTIDKTVLSAGAASIDLRLGTWFATVRTTKKDKMVINPLPTKYIGSDQQCSENEISAKTYYVPFGDKFMLHPHHFVLAVTLQWLRMPYNLAGYVIGKSSWGRVGLIIATATGVHPGFMGCLTLELANVGEVPIELKPGIPIGQLFLHTVDGNKEHDITGFIGLRKPKVREISEDEFTRRLGIPYKGV